VSRRQRLQVRPRAAQPAASEQEPTTVPTGPWVAHDAPTAARDRLIEETIALWQPHCPRPLTAEEARQMIENVAGFFSLLARWEAEERGQEDAVPVAA
jgi:hypothetical protein